MHRLCRLVHKPVNANEKWATLARIGPWTVPVMRVWWGWRGRLSGFGTPGRLELPGMVGSPPLFMTGCWPMMDPGLRLQPLPPSGRAFGPIILYEL